MINLRNIKNHYVSGNDDLGRDFFLPCLQFCNEYWRAAGYFSSSSFITWAKALENIAFNDSLKIKLLISPEISEDDFNAIKNALDPELKNKILQETCESVLLNALKIIEDPNSGESVKIRLKILSWLIANEKLDIRFAVPSNSESYGMYHEKYGVFFINDNHIAFTGSANETNFGYSKNFESIDVFKSWELNDKDRVSIKLNQFETAWDGKSLGLNVMPLSKKTLDIVKEISDKYNSKNFKSDKIDRWAHQSIALEEFLKVCSGVLEMATGTGKTRTALNIAAYLRKNRLIKSLVITTDGVDLLEQWRKEVDSWNLKFNDVFAVLRHYNKYHEIGSFLSNPNNSILIISRSALKNLFLMLPSEVCKSTFIIHDEVHGLGSPDHVLNLHNKHQFFKYKLGLSATPEREYDNEGTIFIKNEIGDVFYKFGLEDAIRNGILCEFEYIPLMYDLTDNDKERLQQVHAKKRARELNGNPMSKEEFWIELSKVYKTAELKPAIFYEYIKNNPKILNSSIIFVETKEYGEKILPFIHEFTYKYRTYYAEDEQRHLYDFSKQKIDCLVTCHRISQGIDINNLKNVILFSSSRAKLETVQRIGRCLRRDPVNPYKIAKVVDFVRNSNKNEEFDNADIERQRWLSNLSSNKVGM